MPQQHSDRQRTGLPFTSEEWDLLVRLPGRVVVAATSAEADTSRRTVSEGLAGIEAIAAGRGSGSRLVRDVVGAIYHESDDDAPAAEEFRDRAGGIADVLDSCRVAARVLAERAGREDTDAYRHWLESIAARVCQASRTGGLFGMGGLVITPAEREFLAGLGAAFDH
jgi:hypothetical protein